jgi:radical SAM superfamily enzyme YgiQ (UPF0313 family)
MPLGYRVINSHRRKILLLKVERLQDIMEISPPLGLMYVADAARKAGFDVEIIHEVWTHHFKKWLINKINKYKDEILLIGFSTITGPSLDPTIQASETLKRNFPSIPIIWGGVHASLLPRQTLENDFLDIVVIGEGEETLIELAECLNKGDSLDKVRGIGYKEGGKIHLTEAREFLENLDKYQPAWDLVDINKYFWKLGEERKALFVVTSRGCPYGCTFCYNTTFNKRRWRSHSVEYVVSQIKMLKERYGVNAIYFQDDNFFTDKARAYEILERIDMPWYAEIRADNLDEEDIKKMKGLKCERLFIGAESGSNRVLREVIKKGITTSDIIKAVNICKDTIRLTLSFIIGFPRETRREIFKTLDFISQLRGICKENEFILNVLAIVPGTEIYYSLPGEVKPRNTREWAYITRQDIDHKPWIKKRDKIMFKSILMAHEYLSHYQGTKSKFNKFILAIEKFRWRYKFFHFPVEIKIVEARGKLNKWMRKVNA